MQLVLPNAMRTYASASLKILRPSQHLGVTRQVTPGCEYPQNSCPGYTTAILLLNFEPLGSRGGNRYLVPPGPPWELSSADHG